MTNPQDRKTPGASRPPGGGSARTCDRCGKDLITHRADARFCNKDCSNAWHNANRLSGTATDKHLMPVSGGVGSRGGNVRSVSEARDLQSASKELDRWRLIMEQQVFRTLLATGYFHVDDLDCLDLPPTAFEVRGTLVNRVRAKGWMQRSGAERKVAHKAANARKAPIYRITAKGRNELPTLVGNRAGEVVVSSPGGACPVSGESIVEGRDQARTKDAPVNATPGGASSDQPRPRSSVEEQRISKPTVAGSSPAGGLPTLVGEGGGNAAALLSPGPAASGPSSLSGEKAASSVPDSANQDGVTSSPSPALGADGFEGVSSAPSEPARLFSDEGRTRPRLADIDQEWAA